MAKKKTCKTTSKPAQTSPKTTCKRITKKEQLGKQGIEQGYKAVIKLSSGEKLRLANTGLADDTTDDYLPVVFETKEQAYKSAKLIAKRYYEEYGVKVSPAVGKAYDLKESIIRTKPTKVKPAKSAKTSPKTTGKPSEGKSYTVRQGRTCKTFATKAEAQACAASASKGKATITTTTKPPTHKIVKFAVRK